MDDFMDVKNTFEEYKLAIYTKYEIAKNQKNSDYLLDPTPANLKNFCAEIIENCGAKDQEIFNAFFKFKEETTSKRKAIIGFETDRFKPLTNFLKSKSNLKEKFSANLLAVLVDFEPRPFVKFKETAFEKITPIYNKEENVFIKSDFESKTGLEISPKKMEQKRFLKKMLVFFGLIVVVSLSAFGINKALEKKCMIWKNDHYESVDCDMAGTNSTLNYEKIVPLNNDVLKSMKKVAVSDTTEFFKNGKPAIWYLKENNEIEYFTAPGLHPVTGNTLKKITPHIINSHVKKGLVGSF